MVSSMKVLLKINYSNKKKKFFYYHIPTFISEIRKTVIKNTINAIEKDIKKYLDKKDSEKLKKLNSLNCCFSFYILPFIIIFCYSFKFTLLASWLFSITIGLIIIFCIFQRRITNFVQYIVCRRFYSQYKIYAGMLQDENIFLDTNGYSFTFYDTTTNYLVNLDIPLDSYISGSQSLDGYFSEGIKSSKDEIDKMSSIESIESSFENKDGNK